MKRILLYVMAGIRVITSFAMYGFVLGLLNSIPFVVICCLLAELLLRVEELELYEDADDVRGTEHYNRLLALEEKVQSLESRIPTEKSDAE